MRALKVRSMVAGHQKLTTTIWEDHWKSSYNYTRSCPRTQCQPFYSHLAFEANWKGEKLDKWVPHELTENQKNHSFEVLSSLILHNNNKPFLDQIGCAAKSGFYTTTSNDQLSGWTKKKCQSTSQTQTLQKKVMVSFWWSVAHLIHYSFLNPNETITSEKYAQHIDETYWKLQCLQTSLIKRMGPILHNNTQPHVA